MYKSDGFIYPAVLFVSAAVLLVISYTSSDFITRKTFAKEAGSTGAERTCSKTARCCQAAIWHREKRPELVHSVFRMAPFLFTSPGVIAGKRFRL